MLTEEMLEYSIQHTTEENVLLKELNRETHLKVLYPRMLAGHMQGKLLEMISSMIRPKCVLEIGTYTGYSAICFSKGLMPGGLIHTIEQLPEHEEMILRYFKKAEVESKIKLHIGDAIDVIPSIDEVLDLVYIDADKENYLNYYNMVFDKVRSGGYILADNALWGGKVMEISSNDKETQGIVEFNDFVQQDERVENILLPFRDGLMIVRKLQ